ncbi:MAG: YggS family pyridoxal phosphate-dependent enzyme [Clostridia bacterium]|nr:YggS family pyridoxal phosphate-dependent enzyme [Clostridia bacterium]
MYFRETVGVMKADNMTCDYSYIKRNLENLREELSDIADRVGVKTPTLVAVTKSGSDEELLELVRAGGADIGENRPQEVKRRGDIIRDAGLFANMHEIGNLQRNKVKTILPNVSLIHSVDSVKLALEIDRLAKKEGIVVPVLIEVNSAKEEAKGGVFPEDAEALLNSLTEMPGIKVSGLMTMGPVSEVGEGLRKYFRLTKKLFDELHCKYGFGDNPILSMGMSDSYEIAIEEGSTLVRIGRKLFIK